MLKKIIKFGITGGLGTVTNLILFFIFSDKLGYPAGVISFCCFFICATQNYIINHLWTFKVENEGTRLSFLLWGKFIASSTLGFLVNFSVLLLLTKLFDWKYNVIPQGIGILAGMVVNFLFTNFFVFKHKKNQENN